MQFRFYSKRQHRQSFFTLRENGYSNITTPDLEFNSNDHFNSYNYSAYPTLTLNIEVLQIYCDNGTGATDAIYSYVPFNSSDLITGNNGLTISSGETYLQETTVTQ